MPSSTHRLSRTLRRRAAWFGGTAAIALMVGCGPSESSDPMAGCIEVSRERLDGIQAGLIVASGSLTEAWAYPSGAHETGYFVAAEIEAPEYLGDGDEHLYFVISLESRGLTFSVDEVTDEFSDWPDGTMMDPRTSIEDPGVQEARECLREAQRNR